MCLDEGLPFKNSLMLIISSVGCIYFKSEETLSRGPAYRKVNTTISSRITVILSVIRFMVTLHSLFTNHLDGTGAFMGKGRKLPPQQETETLL